MASSAVRCPDFFGGGAFAAGGATAAAPKRRPISPLIAGTCCASDKSAGGVPPDEPHRSVAGHSHIGSELSPPTLHEWPHASAPARAWSCFFRRHSAVERVM